MITPYLFPPPREIRGKARWTEENIFKATEEFEKMIAQDELIEYARYVNHYYGTPRSYVEEQLENGKDVILEIEIQGALKVKEKFPDTLLVFITPPSAKELRRRLIGRGTESMEVIEQRLARAKEEAEGIDDYDCLIVNDDLESCVDELHSVIQNEKKKSQGTGSSSRKSEKN